MVRSATIAQIEQHLAGAIDAAALAAWAFNQFYAIEQAEDDLPPAETECIMDVLDALMFGDDPRFALDRNDLQRLITQLQSL